MASETKEMTQDAMADCIEQAWGIIANANEGVWENATPEWVAAAARWRDTWVGWMSARAAERAKAESV